MASVSLAAQNPCGSGFSDQLRKINSRSWNQSHRCDLGERDRFSRFPRSAMGRVQSPNLAMTDSAPPLQDDDQCLAGAWEEKRPMSLAMTLSAIQDKRGTLYMLEMSRYLIEKWDFSSDQLQFQTEDTLDLVAKLLKA
jgi:hypothetical protein